MTCQGLNTLERADKSSTLNLFFSDQESSSLCLLHGSYVLKAREQGLKCTLRLKALQLGKSLKSSRVEVEILCLNQIPEDESSPLTSEGFLTRSLLLAA